MVERDLNVELAFAHELADAAAAVTLRWFGGRLPVELKADATPVTRVDRTVERAIRDAVAERFPGDGVLGEEEGDSPGVSGRCWVIDPVDGTKLYAEGIPLWTTLIGLTVDDEPVLGLADAPALGDRYHATIGGGAWRGDRRLAVSDVACLEDAFVVHSGVEEWIGGGRPDALMRVAARAKGTRGLSDAWGHLLVAQGSVDALLEHEPCFAWDWTATGVIVREAGGRLSTLAGAPPCPGSDLMVTNGALHPEIVSALAGTGPTSSSIDDRANASGGRKR